MESSSDESRNEDDDDNGLVKHQKEQEYKSFKSVKTISSKELKNSHSAIRTLIAVCTRFPSTDEDSYLNPRIEEFLKTCELKDYDKFFKEKDNVKIYQVSEELLDSAIEFFAKRLRISNIPKYIALHKELARTPQRLSFFEEERLMPYEAAICCTYVLSFYTGLSSKLEEEEEIQIVMPEDSNLTSEEHYSIISHHLFEALHAIPPYWGPCIRTLNLTSQDQEFYTEGAIISWNIFSSAKKGDKPIPRYEKRNTYFYIWSLSGREISRFSNHEKEDEILIPPWSTFIVVKKVKSFFGGRTSIYLREVNLGLCEKPVLWVDDKVFIDRFENETIKEETSKQNIAKRIQFIPKVSSAQALDFLDSTFGQQLMDRKDFKIITNMWRKTDMKEDCEEVSRFGGAYLLKELRGKGFPQKVLIYVRNFHAADEAVREICTDEDGVCIAGNYEICTRRIDAKRFIFGD